MAKKPKKATARVAKKAKGVKGKKKGQSRKDVDRVLSGKLRQPQTPRLPGLKGMAASKKLDEICGSLHESREQKNELVELEAGLLSNALAQMKKEDRMLYRAHGVELIRKQGDEKISMKLTKAQGTVDEIEQAGAPSLDDPIFGDDPDLTDVEGDVESAL